MAAEAIAAEERLTPRQREILKVLVQAYISSAEPVGSSTIRRVGRLGVSSATIRNELCRLEELGYLTQPYTSAGRVPTVKGYRYFVEQLVERVDLPASEQRTIMHQFHQIRLHLDQWMKLSAAVLAQTSRSVSLVTPPRAASSGFRHLQLVSISQRAALMILVLADGSAHQEVILIPDYTDQDGLNQVSNRLNHRLRGRSLREVRASVELGPGGAEGLEGELLARIIQLMEEADRVSLGEIYSDGLANVLRHPEFLDIERFRRVVDMLEHASLLEPILLRMLNTNGVQIIIGGEGPYEAIEHVSLVLSRYGVKHIASGVLGIMGPVRMPYARAISTVGYVAQLVGSLMADVYGAYA